MTPLTVRSARRRYLALIALRWLPTGLLIPVTVLLALSRGLSLTEIGLVFSIQGLVVLALELPTGGLSDALGRRPVLIAANSATESATYSNPSETSPTRLARMRIGRRPSESDNPPVGSSRASTTRPWTLKISPISVRDMPRDRASRTVTGISSPVGSQRSPTRMR